MLTPSAVAPPFWVLLLMQTWCLERVIVPEVISKPLQEAWQNEESRLHKRAQEITEVPQKMMSGFTEIVSMWDFDTLDTNLRQSTLVGPETIAGVQWRIDNQENGATAPRGPNGLRYYSIAVQAGGGRGTVYANVLVPMGYRVNRRRIRHALLESQERRAVQRLDVPIGTTLPDPGTGPAIGNGVASLFWALVCLGAGVSQLLGG